MNPLAREALKYVRNANGGATIDHFIEDHEPISIELWLELRFPVKYIELDENCCIVLTENGRKELENEK